MSIRPTIRRATVAGAVAALSLSLLPALATSASAAGTSPNVAFTFMTRHSPSLVAGDGAVKVNAPGDLTSAPSSLLPDGHYVYSFDVSPDGNTAAYLIRTTDSRGNFFDTSSGLVVVHRNTGTDPATITARRVATWVDTNPVVSTSGDKVWWMTDNVIYQYDVSVDSYAALPDTVNTAFKTASTSAYDEYPAWMAVSEAGSSIAVLYDRYDAATGDYYGSRVLAAPVNGPTTASFTASALATADEVPSSSTFVFTDETHLLYAVDLKAGGFSTRLGTVGTPGANAVTAGPGAYYQVDHIGSAWYFWKDDAGISYVGESADPAVEPTTFSQRTDGDSTVRYTPSTVAPPAVPNVLDSTKSTFSAFLNLSTSTVSTGGKAYYLAGGQSEPVGPDPGSYGPQLNFKGELQYSLTGSAPWTVLKLTTGAIATGPNQAYNGLTQSLTRNTWFRWKHVPDLFTDARYTSVRKVSVKPNITISKAKSGTKTKVYGKISRKGGTAVLYKKTSTGSYAKVASTTIGSTGLYSFGYRSLSRGTYRVACVASTYWAANYKNFTI